MPDGDLAWLGFDGEGNFADADIPGQKAGQSCRQEAQRVRDRQGVQQPLNVHIELDGRRDIGKAQLPEHVFMRRGRAEGGVDGHPFPLGNGLAIHRYVLADKGRLVTGEKTDMVIHQMQAAQMFHPHVCRCRHHRHVQTAMQQVRNQLPGRANLQVKTCLSPGLCGAHHKIIDRRMRQQRAGTNAGGWRAATLHRFQHVVRLLQVRANLPALLGKQYAGFRQHDAIATTHHQLASNL